MNGIASHNSTAFLDIYEQYLDVALPHLGLE